MSRFPKESKFFPFRVDPISEGDKTILTVAYQESVTTLNVKVCGLRHAKTCLGTYADREGPGQSAHIARHAV